MQACVFLDLSHKISTFLCLDGGMVDTGDLKSPGSNTVGVRVPLRAS
jgi:hypothetical protein